MKRIVVRRQKKFFFQFNLTVYKLFKSERIIFKLNRTFPPVTHTHTHRNTHTQKHTHTHTHSVSVKKEKSGKRVGVGGIFSKAVCVCEYVLT